MAALKLSASKSKLATHFLAPAIEMINELLKVNFFQKGCFCIEGFHFYKVNIHFFCIFLDFFSKYFLLKLKLFRHNLYCNKNLLRNSSKNWQKMRYSFLPRYPFWKKFAFKIGHFCNSRPTSFIRSAKCSENSK